MKLDFGTLKAKNFLSFGNKEEEFDLSFQGVTNLKGRNLDIDVGKDNSSRNGTGKTTILQAVVYALYGKGIEEGMKQDEFINLTNGKNMRVELNFVVDGKECSIVRTRKPNGVKFIVDGDDVSRDSIANTNELIEQTIGVNYDTFVVSFLMTNGVQPVLSRKPAEQRNFFERLLNMDILSERANAIKAIKSDVNVDIKLVQKDIDHAETTNQKADEQYERTKQKYEQYEQDREKSVEDLKVKVEQSQHAKDYEKEGLQLFENLSTQKEKKNGLVQRKSELITTVSKLSEEISFKQKNIDQKSKDVESYRSRLSQHQEKMESLQSDITSLQEKVDGLKPQYDSVSEYLDLKDTIASKEDEREDLDSQFKSAVSKRDEWIQERDHLKEGNCPYCKQKWNSQEQQNKVEELDQRIDEKDDFIFKNEIKIVDLKEEIGNLEEKISEFDLDDTQAEKIIDEYENSSSDLKQKQYQLEEETEQAEKAKEKVEQLEKFMKEELEETKKEIEDKQKEKDSVQEELDGVGDSLDQIESRIEVIQEKIPELPITNEDEFKKAIANYNHHKEQLEQTQKAVNPFEEDYRAGPQGKVDVAEKQAEKDSLESKLRHCDYMIKLLTDSKSFIRKSIINRYIPYLNKKINTYAESLDSPHFTEIQPDLTVDVEYMRKSVSYHSLSAGERLRLNVSVSLALRDLMATLGTSSDFLMVDELFDSSLDSNGKVNVFNTIKKRLGKVILVSHSGEFDDKCDRVVTAVKQNGFTHLE